jgi:arabinofuranosyltransferase
VTRRRGFPRVAIVSAAASFYAIFILRSGFTVGGRRYFSLFDDAMVSMRFARNLAHGHGLVWNPGQHPVEGYTNLLWTLWMALAHLLPVSAPGVVLAVSITGGILLLVNAAIVGRIARRLGANRAGELVAVVATAFYYPLVFWTLRGMEVGLAAAILSGSLLLALRQADMPGVSVWPLALVCALGTLVRLDLIPLLLIPAAYAIYVLYRARRRLSAAVLVSLPLVAVAGQTAFRLAYYNEPLPNTYYLKISGIPLSMRLGRGLDSFGALVLTHLWAPLVVALACIALGGARKRLGRLWLPLLMFGAACSYSIFVGGDAWEWMRSSNRYVSPVVPFLIVVVLCTVERVSMAPEIRRRFHVLVVGGFALVFVLSVAVPIPVRSLQSSAVPPQVLAVPLAAAWAVWFARRRRSEALPDERTGLLFCGLVIVALNLTPFVHWVTKNGDYVANDAAMARYGLALRASTQPSASLAVVGAGSISYFSDRRTVDLLGKSDHVIAVERPRWHIFIPGHDKWDYDYSIGRMKPDVVTQIWQPTRADLRKLRAWGYEELCPTVWVRGHDSRIALRRLIGFLAALKEHPVDHGYIAADCQSPRNRS